MDKLSNAAYSALNQLYGQLLTQKQRQWLYLYFDCDMSLAEIADQFDVTRQAVRDSLQKGMVRLDNFETELQLSNYQSVARQLHARLKALNVEDSQALQMTEYLAGQNKFFDKAKE